VSEKHRVAVVDDEENIRQSVGFALTREGYEVDEYADGQAALEGFERRPPDLAVLDIMMPRMDGLELCRHLRRHSETLPIIFLTSRDEELDRVLGLELGADDYMGKPFSMRELVARIKVLFRRQRLLENARPEEDEEEVLEVGPLHLDLRRYRVTWRGEAVSLTVTEFLMLHALVRHPGHVKSRAQLTEEAYRYDHYVSDRTIDSHIKRLRRKLEGADDGFDAIETVYGIGYRWKED
jgi:two-component system, OmpR family, response regulator ChvI